MDSIVLILLCVSAMFIVFRAFVDFANNSELTVNDWLEIYIEKAKDFFNNIKDKCVEFFNTLKNKFTKK